MSLDTLPAAFDALRDNAVGLLTDLEQQRQAAVKSQADCAVQLNAARDAVTSQQATIAAAVAENAALKKQLEAGGSGIPLWTPVTVLVAGGTYLLPNGAPVKIDVRVPGVTFVGGWVWPEPNGPMSAITANVGGDDCTVIGTRFSWDDGPSGKAKLPLKPAFRTYAKNAALTRIVFGRLTTGVEAMAPCDGLSIYRCAAGDDVRGGFVYVGGGKGVHLLRTTALDSATENLVRCSPQNGVVPEDFTVEYCDLQNLTAGKAVIELRSVNNGVVRKNKLRASYDHTCCSVGRSDPADGPGSSNVRVFDNEGYNGRFEVDAAASDVEFVNNTQYGLRPNVDIAMKADGRGGVARNVRLRGNRAIIAGATSKPFFAVIAPEQIQGLDVDASNAWVVQPPPVTVPGGQGA